MGWLEDRDGAQNPVNAGSMAEAMRHEHVRQELAKYKRSLDAQLITEDQFVSIREALLRRAGLVPE